MDKLLNDLMQQEQPFCHVHKYMYFLCLSNSSYSKFLSLVLFLSILSSSFMLFVFINLFVTDLLVESVLEINVTLVSLYSRDANRQRIKKVRTLPG